MRDKYKLEKVKVLFIGEALPKSEDSEIRYFYNEKTNRRGSLYWRMANALEIRQKQRERTGKVQGKRHVAHRFI